MFTIQNLKFLSFELALGDNGYWLMSPSSSKLPETKN